MFVFWTDTGKYIHLIISHFFFDFAPIEHPSGWVRSFVLLMVLKSANESNVMLELKGECENESDKLWKQLYPLNRFLTIATLTNELYSIWWPCDDNRQSSLRHYANIQYHLANSIYTKAKNSNRIVDYRMGMLLHHKNTICSKSNFHFANSTVVFHFFLSGWIKKEKIGNASFCFWENKFQTKAQTAIIVRLE